MHASSHRRRLTRACVQRYAETMRGRAVLVVDDNDVFRQTLRRALAARSYRVAVAADTTSALYAASSRAFDFAIIDQRLTPSLADRSGLDLAETLLERQPNLRILIHTGYASADAALRAGRQAGIVDYLPKPAPLEQIIATLEGRAQPAPPPATLERVERDHILRVVADCDGNLTRAANALGIDRHALRRKLGK